MVSPSFLFSFNDKTYFNVIATWNRVPIKTMNKFYVYLMKFWAMVLQD